MIVKKIVNTFIYRKIQNDMNLDDAEDNQYLLSTEVFDTIEKNHSISRFRQSVIDSNQKYVFASIYVINLIYCIIFN